MSKTADKQPQRTCAATGTPGTPATLLRFVQSPKNETGQTQPWPDYTAKLPGRGVWILPTEAAYTQAIKKKAFARNLETNQPPPPWDEIAAYLKKDALQRLGLAKKAGQLVLGLENVLEEAAKGKIMALLLAADVGADAKRKTEALATRVPTMVFFRKAELSPIFGQANAAVVGLTRLDTAWPAVHKAAQALPAPELN